MRLAVPDDLSSLLRSGIWRSVGSLAIKVATAGLTYLTYVVLSRILSAQEYGYFAFGLALATVLAIAGGLGQQIAILRFWAEETARRQPERAIAALRAGGTLTIMASLALGGAVALGGLGTSVLYPAAGSMTHIYAAAILILPMALAEFNSSALRAQGSIITALVPRDILWRLLLPTAALALFYGFGWSLPGWSALLLAAALLGATLLLQYAWSAQRRYRLSLGLSETRPYWLERGTVSRWFLLGAVVDALALNADTVLVGLMVDADSAGMYFNAFRTAGLMTLIGYAVTLVIAPMLSQFYHSGEMRKAQAVTAACVWAGFAFSLLVFVAFVFFGTQILALFGPGYDQAYPVLIILSLGLLADAATGPARSVMMMTGHEQRYVSAFGTITAMGLLLQFLVLPSYGLVGAALAGAGARILANVLIGIWCIQRVGIDPTILGVGKVNRMSDKVTDLSPPVGRPLPSGPRGAILLGGAHGTLALARILRRQGLTVWLVSDDTPLPRFSRVFSRRLAWSGPKSPDATALLIRLAEEGGQGFLLVACSDADVRFLAEQREALSKHFSVLLSPWDQLRWVCDKGLLHQRATELGLGTPTNYTVRSVAEAEAAQLEYPVVLKPSMRVARNRFTVEKAWRADTREQFLALYREAAKLVGADHIVVQELVPGGGDMQFSYAGFWHEGEPVACFTALRRRQYPIEFSYTSTYVETVDAPDVLIAAERLMRSVGHHGLVEIEFKRDSRSGALKILDVNPRPWSWMSLADAAGVDLSEAIVRPGAKSSAQARPNVGWIFAIRDLVATAQLMIGGQIGVRDYLRSLTRARAAATFSWSDPLPGLLEMPLTIVRVLSRMRLHRS